MYKKYATKLSGNVYKALYAHDAVSCAGRYRAINITVRDGSGVAVALELTKLLSQTNEAVKSCMF